MATLPELENALRKAHAAGNTGHARQFAAEIRRMRTEKPDFSNATGQMTGSVQQAPEATVAGQRPSQMGGFKQAAYGLVSPVANAIAGVGQMTGLMDEQDVQASRARIDAVRDTTPGAVAGFAGDVGMMALPLSKVASLPKAGQYAASALAGGTFAGLQPVSEGEDRGDNMMLGGALGALGQGGSDLLMAAGKRAATAITPEVRALYEAAKARGINLTPAQLSDSKALKFLQSQLSRLPIIGGSGKIDAQKAAFNRELAREIGEDAPVVTPEVFARAKSRQGQQFEELTSRNDLRMTPELIRKLEAIRSDAAAAGDDAQSAVSSALDSFYKRAGQGSSTTPEGAVSESFGDLPGRMFQSLDSQLGQVTKLGTPASHYVGQVQAALREAMDSSISPADSAAWQALRRQYGNRKTIRDLVAKGDGGEISPAALMGRVSGNNSGKEAMATGRRGGLGELARIGQRIKDPPSSGTAERLMSAGVGAGAIANLPLTLAALLAGGATKKGLDSSLLARLMMREGRGKTAQALAPVVRAGATGAVVPATKKRSDDSRKRK